MKTQEEKLLPRAETEDPLPVPYSPAIFSRALTEAISRFLRFSISYTWKAMTVTFSSSSLSSPFRFSKNNYFFFFFFFFVLGFVFFFCVFAVDFPLFFAGVDSSALEKSFLPFKSV